MYFRPPAIPKGEERASKPGGERRDARCPIRNCFAFAADSLRGSKVQAESHAVRDRYPHCLDCGELGRAET